MQVQVKVMVPPGLSLGKVLPFNPDLPNHSSLLATILAEQQVELVEQGWDGQAESLPDVERVLVHVTTIPGCRKRFRLGVIEACGKSGHLAFRGDRVFEGSRQIQNRDMVRQLLEQFITDLRRAQS